MSRHADIVAAALWYRGTDAQRARWADDSDFMAKVNRGCADLPDKP